MPGSSDELNGAVMEVLTSCPSFARFLDVGPGTGKYGKLLRDVYGANVDIEAVEICDAYPARFGLRQIYNRVLVKDAWSMLLDRPDSTWDLAVLGDVIEHFPKTRGIDLLHYLVIRCKVVLVVYPVHTKSSPFYNYTSATDWKNAAEAHVSQWKPGDFDEIAAAVHVSGIAGGGAMRMAQMKGLLT